MPLRGLVFRALLMIHCTILISVMSQKDGAFVVLFRDETKSEVFLVLRSDKPIWNLPGGGIENNETPEDAAIREAFEETGFDIALHRKIGVYENIDFATGGVWNHVHLFEGNVVSGTFKPEFPGCEGAWFPVDKLPNSAMPVTKTRIADVLEHQGKPFFKQYRPELRDER